MSERPTLDMGVSVRPDSLTTQIATAFESRGHELYLVGGAVRDALLGSRDIDLDFATSALPPTTIAILEEMRLGTPYRIGEAYGTIGIRVGDRDVEITTYRSAERYDRNSRKPTVALGGTLQTDLQRRDFTVNAMALQPLTGELIDTLGGRRDLENHMLRAVGVPAERFAEDPLRLLRGVRFASNLDLTVEHATWQAMQEAAPRLASISRERVRDEYSRMLVGPDPVRAMTLLRDSGLMGASVPELLDLTRMPDHGPRHPLSLWDHVMQVLRRSPPTLLLRWAALLHDIAKPRTRSREPSGRPRFFGHEEMGADIARSVLTGLRYPRDVVDSVATLVETHMQLHGYSSEWSDGAVRRLMRRLDDLIEPAIALARADAEGHALHTIDGRANQFQSANGPKFDHLVARLSRLREQPPESLASPLTGHDLMQRYNRPPGEWIGRIKAGLEDEVIDGTLAPGDLEAAWRIADRLIDEMAPVARIPRSAT